MTLKRRLLAEYDPHGVFDASSVINALACSNDAYSSHNEVILAEGGRIRLESNADETKIQIWLIDQ